MIAEKEDLDLVVARANENGVKYMQTICTNLDELPTLITIAEKYPNIFASVGVHPNEVNDIPIASEQLINLSNHPKIIGLGETGLDYHYQGSTKEQQMKAFREHIVASQDTSLPVIIHTRDAEEDTFSLINSEMKNKPFKGLIHCFTASPNFAKKVLDLGLYISIAGIVTFKNADELREVVRFVPLDRLLIETDSPYLAPVPMRGKTNEPAFVKYVAEFIADLKQTSTEEIAEFSTDNFFTLFSKAQYT
jgi:TatD DNase family protein